MVRVIRDVFQRTCVCSRVSTWQLINNRGEWRGGVKEWVRRYSPKWRGGVMEWVRRYSPKWVKSGKG